MAATCMVAAVATATSTTTTPTSTAAAIASQQQHQQQHQQHHHHAAFCTTLQRMALELPRGGRLYDDDNHNHDYNVEADHNHNGAYQETTSNNHNNQDHNDKSTKKKKTKKKKKKKTDTSNSSSSSTASSSSSSSQQQSPNKDDNDPLIQSILNETSDYYTVLGVSRDATPATIQKAYRRRAVRTHPDKRPNGDRAAFDKVSEAYQVLNDAEKRQRYDRFGKEGVQENSGGTSTSSFANDIFRSFFTQDPYSSSSSSYYQQQQHRNRTLRYQLAVTLEELYNGAQKQVLVEQPGGHEPKQVTVDLPRGLSEGESVVLPGSVDAIPGAAPGDLVFVLAQQAHPVFTRKGHDLAIQLTIDLHEAVGGGGVQRTVTHLDGTTVPLRSAIVQHDAGDVQWRKKRMAMLKRKKRMAMKKKLQQQQQERASETMEQESGVDGHYGNNNEATTTTTRNTNDIGSDNNNNNNNNDHDIDHDDNDEEDEEEDDMDVPLVIRNGDIHVLKGQGMPKRGTGMAGEDPEYGDLYVVYKVRMPSEESLEKLTPSERRELHRLLAKLDDQDVVHKKRNKMMHNNNNSNREGTDQENKTTKDVAGENHGNGSTDTPSIPRMSKASASDFGRASGPSNNNGDDGYPHMRANNPFFGSGSRSRQFFWSSNSGYSHGGPGGDHDGNGDDESDVQCRQM